ncbi:MAG: ribosome maturation factor RimM [Bdellovibrionales bacterium]
MGWVKDAHALKGEIYIQLHAGRADWLDRVEELYLVLADQLKPLPLERAKPFKEGLIVKFKGVDDRNAAELLRKSEVFITESALVSRPGENLFLAEVLGFQVKQRQAPIGEVVGFTSNGAQDLLKVRLLDGRESLIPLVEAFLVHIDRAHRVIEMDLPEGLIDLEE